ncbi:MAG: hypothetical protein V4482_06420 [Pseudomonadota bacterium]
MKTIVYTVLLTALFATYGFSMNVVDRVYPGRAQKYNEDPLNRAIFGDTRELNAVLSSRPSNKFASPEEKKRIFKAIIANKIIHGQNMGLVDDIAPYLAAASLIEKSIIPFYAIN